MTRYNVTAIAVDPEHPNIVSPSRVEEIDTETNDLFHGCKGPWDVEDVYEAYWNRLNASWEYDFPPGKERVKVISVREV